MNDNQRAVLVLRTIAATSNGELGEPTLCRKLGCSLAVLTKATRLLVSKGYIVSRRGYAANFTDCCYFTINNRPIGTRQMLLIKAIKEFV